MEVNKVNPFIQRQAKDGLTRTNHRLESKLTPAVQQELLRLERTLLEQGSFASGAETPDRLLERSQLSRQSQRSKTPHVGIFHVVEDEPLKASLPWNEIPRYAGYRTFGVGHYDLWTDLVESGRAPEAAYQFFPRRRVGYHDATRTFTLFTDPCLLRNKALTEAVVKLFKLPDSTSVLADKYYTCEKCDRRREPSEYGFLDWNWDELAFYLSHIGAH